MGLSLPPPEQKREFVRDLFDRIAPRYDLVNRLMTLGMDRAWRRATVEAARVAADERVLDLACGTGDLAALCRARGASVIGLDLSRAMLEAARRRAPGCGLVQGDGSSLPLPDASLDVVTCGFALRNFAEIDPVLDECARVLVPGGRLALLEVDEPRSRPLRWGHALHFRRVVPRLGAWLSDAEAYRYLPDSVTYLPDEAGLRARLARAGFESCEKRRRMWGAIQLWIATRGGSA